MPYWVDFNMGDIYKHKNGDYYVLEVYQAGDGLTYFWMCNEESDEEINADPETFFKDYQHIACCLISSGFYDDICID